VSAATRRLILGAAALGALACGDIASPERTDLYEWRLFVPGVGGGTDTLSFFWSQSRLPVRIWAEDAAGLPGFAERAIGVWESGFLYREFRGEMVSDSSTADVLMFANSAPNLTLGVRRLHSMAPECSGATDLEVSDDHTQLLVPIRVFIDPKSMVYLDGTELDFVTSIMGHGFKFNNPNVKGACGCGESVQF